VIAHQETSLAAALSIAGHVESMRRLVLWYIASKGGYGATDEEIQTMLDMNPSTERPRRGELVKAGKVRDSGNRRETISRRKAIVWVAVLQQGDLFKERP
jgi:hypothetical protein